MDTPEEKERAIKDLQARMAALEERVGLLVNEEDIPGVPPEEVAAVTVLAETAVLQAQEATARADAALEQSEQASAMALVAGITAAEVQEAVEDQEEEDALDEEEEEPPEPVEEEEERASSAGSSPDEPIMVAVEEAPVEEKPAAPREQEKPKQRFARGRR